MDIAMDPVEYSRSVEYNKSVMRTIVENNDARTFDAYTDLIADDFVGHNHFVPGDLQGKYSLGGFFYVTEEVAFPDGTHTIHQLFGEGDYVTLVLSYQGTFTGPLPNGTPPNGKKIEFRYNILCRFAGGKLAELWWYPYDSHTLMQELGMI
jgi:predicted ester cyclase